MIYLGISQRHLKRPLLINSLPFLFLSLIGDVCVSHVCTCTCVQVKQNTHTHTHTFFPPPPPPSRYACGGLEVTVGWSWRAGAKLAQATTRWYITCPGAQGRAGRLLWWEVVLEVGDCGCVGLRRDGGKARQGAIVVCPFFCWRGYLHFVHCSVMFVCMVSCS